jgi:hypothetical protein
MRKRMKRGFICRACGSQIIPEHFELPEIQKYPHVKIFGEWKRISENEVHNYVGFQIEYR